MRRAVLGLVMAFGLSTGCGDDDGGKPVDAAVDGAVDAPAATGGSGGASGSGGGGSGGGAAGRDGGAAGAGGSAGASGAGGAAGAAGAAGRDGGAPDGGMVSAAVMRGAQLVGTLSCGRCHTPLNAMMQADATKLLSGRLCVTDEDKVTGNNMGCVHASNLTNDETGLKNVTDGELKNMLTKGMRMNGRKLHPTMPYWHYSLLSNADVDAIIAYLRTVPAIGNRVPAHETPNDMGATETVPLLQDKDLPASSAMGADAASAKRGQYLSAIMCLDCHTPAVMNPGKFQLPFDITKAFAGGRAFGPYMTMPVSAANLTPHGTGLRGWTVDHIVRALKMGKDKDDKNICPPMPSGPMGAYANLPDQDARDIATYLTTIPGVDNAVAAQCAY